MALLPNEGDIAEWVMCQPSGTVLYSCQKMGTILGRTVVVFGQGSIGLSFTAITARAGARKVIANNTFKHVSSNDGRVIIFGIQEGGGDGTVPLYFRGMFKEGITVVPTQGAASADAIDHIQTMVELKQRGWWDPGEMVTHRMNFDDVKAAYDMYENIEDDVVKVVMNM